MDTNRYERPHRHSRWMRMVMVEVVVMMEVGSEGARAEERGLVVVLVVVW